jgi:regulator of cell morphogenesis and NO signaling
MHIEFIFIKVGMMTRLLNHSTGLNQHRNTQWTAAAPAMLIDHVLSRYHAVHRAQLPELISLARQVEVVHNGDPSLPVGLAALLQTIFKELQLHMEKEEVILFPMLQAGGTPFVCHPIAMMRSEHEEHLASLDKLAALTHNATPDPTACKTWRKLYSGIAQFNDDLLDHIDLENTLLFSQFEAPQQTHALPQ